MRESGYDAATDAVSVHFVTIGSQAKADEFCGPFGPAARCVGDANKASYRAMGLEDFSFLKLFTDADLQKRRAQNRSAGFSQNWGATKLSDAAQLPGAAIVDAEGILRWIHRGTHPGDLPPLREMLDRAHGLIH